MGILNKIKETLKPKPADHCASGYPKWKPSKDWTPEFEDHLVPEAYDAD